MEHASKKAGQGKCQTRRAAQATGTNGIARSTIRLKSADRWPITATLVPEELWAGGLGTVLFARRMPDSHIAVAGFLVDVFCLGIKNAFWRMISSGEFDDLKQQIAEGGGPLKTVSPEYVSKLVHQAAHYGQSLGFLPHADFRHARLLLAGRRSVPVPRGVSIRQGWKAVLRARSL